MAVELTEESKIVQRFKELMAEDITEARVPRDRRIFALVDEKAFKKAIEKLVKDLGFTHISTITGVDLGEEIELIYHLSREGSIELSLKVRVSKGKPVLPTITDVMPGAPLYEREVHDLFGVVFQGHPNLSRLVLPEEWPENVYPLRKEWKLEEVEDIIPEKRGEEK